MSTDDYFRSRPSTGLARKRVFTDRLIERRMLQERIDATTSTAPGPGVLFDYARGASNLTTIWGFGGIGKSALLAEIRRDFEDRHREERPTCINIDFSDYTNHDFEAVLIKVRSAMAGLHRRWPAFDLAFASYWTRKHPGVDLIKFISNARFLDQAQREAMIDQMSAILEVVLGGVGVVGATYKIYSSLKQKVSDSVATKKLMKSCPPFRVLINEPDPDVVLGYLPTLLAYDLSEISGSTNVRVLCTLDTLEYIEKPGQERGSLQDLVSRLVYLMPNIAFVSGSRRRSTWADETGRIALHYGGAEKWPDLVEGGEGQYRINGLADDYAHQLLVESLDLEGKPAIPEHVRHQIVHGASGLPLHLELSVDWYYDAASRGIEDLSHRVARSFPELVQRIMRDLTPVECDLLRAACLIEAFDEALLAEIVPEARRSEIQAFLTRPMIERTPLSWLPYSLHDSLRECVVEQDRFTDRCWTEEEWRDNAFRATAWLALRVLPAWDVSRAGTSPEEAGRQVVSAMLLTANAAIRHGIQPEHLGELAFLTAELGFPAAFLSISDDRITHESSSLVRLIAAARVHANKELDHVIRYRTLKPLVLFDPDDGYDHFIAAIFGHSADVEGAYDEAQRAYRSIRSSQSFLDSFGKLGVAGSALRSGHLRTALRSVVQVPDHPLQVASRLDLLGHIHIQGGEHDKGADYFEQALAAARESGSPLWVARALRHVAHARMWFDPEGTLAVIPEATEINASLNEYTGLAQLEQATAVAHAWRRDWDAAEEALAACKSRDLDPIAIGHPAMAEMLLAVGQGDGERARRAAGTALADPRARQSPDRRPHVWLAVIALWADRPDVNTFEQIEWYDSPLAARRRFSAVFDRAVALAGSE